MKRTTAVFLFLALFIPTAISLLSCARVLRGNKGEGGGNDTASDTITVPEYKDYERGTVDFSAIVYSRPDTQALIRDFDSVRKKIFENKLSYDELLDEIYALEEGYSNFLTMLTYANIKLSINNSDEYWINEYELLSTAYPSFSNAVEDLYVAAAQSPHSESFEKDYFGKDLIEDYADGGKYTDAAVSLMESEAELEADYQSISTATVKISYLGRYDTPDNILDYCKSVYGEDSSHYLCAERECMELYESAAISTSKDILVVLFKLRRKISDEFGYSSYREFAYETIYHDYTKEEFLRFANGISEYVLPVYTELSDKIFNHGKKAPRELSGVELINNTYEAMKKAPRKTAMPFSYMLKHSLYNIDSFSNRRFSGSFTTYLDDYNAPFIFASTNGDITDYTTLVHEYGHFLDAYYNYNSATSLDLSEVSSQALELLILSEFEGILSDDDIDFLLLCEMERLLETIIFQGFYAAFEHIAYEMDYEDISIESLNGAVLEAAELIGLNSAYLNDVEYVLIPHIALYPFYVQSYCTSAATALEIYFEELDCEGVGFEIYENLVIREDGGLTFTEYLEKANLSSPFEKDKLKTISDRIYFELCGSHYFTFKGEKNSA